MPTRAAHGSSHDPDSRGAARAATAEALAGLGGETARIGFLFASPIHDLALALATVREATSAEVIGCTTAGELTENGLLHGGLVLLLVASDDLLLRAAFATGLGADPEAAASALCDGFAELKDQALRQRKVHSTTVLLTDGLSGSGEAVVEGLLDRLGAFQQVVGGAAGDEGKFETTSVGAGGQAAPDAVAALHVFGSRGWGVGVGHGLRHGAQRLEVTRASGNVVYELDGRPAFEAYRQHARERGVELDPATAGPYMINNELGVFAFGQMARARAPLKVGADGSLTCAAAIDQGASVAILEGDPAGMIAAATEAAHEARRGMGGGAAAAVIVFDCICRGQILGGAFRGEIDAVRTVFGEVPIAGFLTYGEIARYPGRLHGWHNATAVVLAIPA